MSSVDLGIVGAGPAGLAAAVEARSAGHSVALLDEAAHPGGQIYRNIDHAGAKQFELLGPDYAYGKALTKAFGKSGCSYLPKSSVWHVEQRDTGFRLSYSRDGRSHGVDVGSLIIATGALERPMPLPGWTLPGVTTAGAIQILLKASATVADDLVLVGSGPLLILLAAQLVTSGYPPRAIVETVPLKNYVRALPRVPFNASGLGYLYKGSKLLARVARAGVPIFRDARDIVIEGTKRVEAVSFRSKGRAHRVETMSVGLHHGVVPNQQITRLMRCEHVWDQRQHAFLPILTEDGETSVHGLFVAGDGGGIRGAHSAEIAGRLAALKVIERMTGESQAAVKSLRKKLKRDASVRPFLEALYPPFSEALVPSDDTLVCRCEEVTAGQIRDAVRDTASEANQVKSFLRTGMGPCQGRVCGLAVTELIAEASGRSRNDVGYFRIRPPLKPLSLNELADYETEAQ
ncbi:MAG TPA: NAD(P)/FAD-dependent oxidoreductase [Woeseiaceae bacterium]|nr:NAD(P)/FAD-dependent oxidoreductase [Woeseiaceae bacterium]